MARASIFLIIVALVGGSMGCAPTPSAQYDLTISSTEGGSVIDPGEGTFTYDEGTVVDLVAEADGGYYFIYWTGDVGTIADVNDASTSITMNGDYEVTADFDAPPPLPYNLTIASTAGGDVTTPGEGTFLYAAGTLVDLVATPASGYRFVNWSGDVAAMADINLPSTTITINDHYSIVASFARYTPMVAAGAMHTVGLRCDGTVVAVGDNEYGQCDVGDWKDITQVAAYAFHTVGLKADGTVVAAGYNDDGQCDVGDWTGITQIAAGTSHTLGVKSDGTAVAAGDNTRGQCNVGNWTGIIQVDTVGGEHRAGSPMWVQLAHTVGLKADGTVVAVGDNVYGQCNVSGWAGIVQIATGTVHTVGLKADGTVIAVGNNEYGQCDVSGWTGIIQVAAGVAQTVGLEADGSVVATGWNGAGQCNVGTWTDIRQVAAGYEHTVGVHFDGGAVAAGRNDSGQCSVGDWDLN